MGLGAAIAGGLQGVMQGYDYQNELTRQRKMEDFNFLRQQRADQRDTTLFDQQQADYQHDLNRRPMLEQREDESYGLQRAIDQARLKSVQHDLDREPELDRQHDAEFELNQESKRQQMRTEALRQRLKQMGIDEKQQARAQQAVATALGTGFRAYIVTGDPSGITHAWNSVAPQLGMSPIDDLTKNDDGSFTLTMQGQEPIAIKDDQHLASTIATVSDPGNFNQLLFSSEARKAEALGRAKNPRNYGELITGQDGTLNRYDYATGNLSPVTDAQGRPVQGTLAGRNAPRSASDDANSIYKNLLGKYNSDGALKGVRDYMDRVYPGVPGWWNGGQDQSGPSFAQGAPATTRSTQYTDAPPVPGARRAADGRWYVPDPQRPGKYLLAQ